jgi:hypothetical protein
MDGWDKFYQTVVDETQKGVWERLDRFRISLGDWFWPTINWPTPDWRDQLYLFVEHTRHSAIEAARQAGIRAKMKQELAEIRAGGDGSGVWSEAELREIRETGQFPGDAVWHHDPTVANRPDLAAEPGSVRPNQRWPRGAS